MNENELFFINDNTDKHGYSKGVCRLCIDELNQLENNPNKPKERERERDENSPPQPSPNNPKSFN
jgi:hypothetical protein